MPEQSRKKEDYLDLGRNFYENHYKAEAGKAERAIEDVSGTPQDKASYKLKEFLQNNVWGWIKHYFKSRFGKKYPYKTYDNKTDNGIYGIDNGNVEIICAADWASDTPEADRIGRRIASHKPEYTIHLGDTYFVGAYFEIENNFLSPTASWHKGSKGSFALLGNHEMYSRGKPFFENLLPALGLRVEGTNGYSGQKAGFFCLENDHWRVIGIDTGYNSVGKIPIIEKIFPPNCALPPELIEWLKNTLRLKEDKRGLVFLSHHQYQSAFESEYDKPAEQLAEIIGKDRPVIWIWGHEHRLALYGKYQNGEGITAYGRCIGHGGMPVEIVKEKDKPSRDKVSSRKLVLYDNRYKETIGGTDVGVNGYVSLKLNNENLTMEYYDAGGRILFEKWKADNTNGQLKGEEIKVEIDALDVVQEAENAIK